MSKVLDIRHLSKSYRLDKNAATTLRESISNRLKLKKTKIENLQALNDITFSINQGDIVGITGANGAGKSTLLKVLSKITFPSAGEVEIMGRCASLLEIGTGFHPELTGRENVFFNGSLLGLKREEVADRFDDIVAFAEIDEFIDVPVKRYSSGMYVRLAFAIAAHLKVELLIIDEVLAVGDDKFQSKCKSKIRELAQQGAAVLIVSPNLTMLEHFVSRLMIMDHGCIVFDGLPSDAVHYYRNQP